MKASTPNAADWHIARAWVSISRLRLLDRSAISPAQAENNSTGPNWQADSNPMAMPLSVLRRISSVRATIVIQLPTWEMVCPTKNSRKFRDASEAKMLRRPTGAAAQGSSSGGGDCGC